MKNEVSLLVAKRIVSTRPPVNASAREIERYLRGVARSAGNRTDIPWKQRLPQPLW